MNKPGYVYILTSPDKNVLYIGVTSDLRGRIWKHRTKFYPQSFTSKYNCTILVYYQFIDSIGSAIAEEKRLKAGSRQQKIFLINSINPDWRDLWEDVF